MQEQPETASRNRARLARRAVLAGGLAAIWGGWAWFSRRGGTPDFAFNDIPGAPGFRALAGKGGLSAVSPLLVGVDRPAAAPAPLAPEALCAALFAAQGAAPPVAVFSDFYCPNCRRLAPVVSEIAGRRGLSLTWHEWPVLGPASEAAARAALAAAAQGQYTAFQQRMLRAAFQPTGAYLSEVAESAGLDPARLARDMFGAEVEHQLERTARAAATLGLLGTPSIVVGRTVVSGVPDARDLEALIRLEAQQPAFCAA